MKKDEVPHTLIIESYDEDNNEYEYTIQHLDTCPSEEYPDFEGNMFKQYTCGVEYEIDAIGLVEALGIDETLSPGEYKIRAWSDHDSYSGEYDGGLELVNDSAK